ncbi:MAG TPA: extracellular solute-binding protein [Stellaceae bacterium]|nr:extracellular solute-binding protein [Stellaceae bacterium]
MRAVLAALLAALFALPAAAQSDAPSYGLSLFGDPLKYPPGFTHFDYINPDAPKGGSVRFGDIGTFDNLNPFILRGVSYIRFADSMVGTGAVYDSLMAGALDEPNAAYGLIAQSVELPPDRSSITFTLHPEARFQDGSPITAEDVCWTYETLITKGHPQYRVIFANVEKCDVLGPHRVKFQFKNGNDRDLPMEVAGLPVLSKKWWQGRDFSQPTLDIPLGSGPYRIAKVDPGRSITYERVKNYWAQDLPVNKGTNNFDTMRVDYYRDMSVMFEALKAGQIDVRGEYTAKDWATAYDFPAVKDGMVIKAEVHHEVPQGMQGFVFNTRRPIFSDPRVRRAIGYLFDFQWTNKTILYSAYKRTKSYWENSDLAAHGLPQGEELKLLESYRGRIPDAVFTTPYEPPVYDGSGDIRPGIREALRLFQEAGWSVKGGKLVNDKTGQPFTFEFLSDEPRLEKVVLPFLENLRRVGIFAQMRDIDAAQYENRMRNYDFDMIMVNYAASLSPGTELREFFGSAAAKHPGSANTSGIEDPVVDDLIERAIRAKSRAALVPIVHALDRVLLNGYYVVPLWYADYYRVAYWNKFGLPKVQPKYASSASAVINTWWIDSARLQQASQRQVHPGPEAH